MTRPSSSSLALALFATTFGCISFERVSRPPTPAEIARIDEAASEGSLYVRYVEPIAAPGAPHPPSDLATVASADASTIMLESRIGKPTTIPPSQVKGVSVNGQRGRAAAIGPSDGRTPSSDGAARRR